jgi:hypothetical protein
VTGAGKSLLHRGRLDLFGTEVLGIAEILGRAHTAGWRLVHLSTADQREWNEFETSWAAGPQESLLAHPNDEQAPSVRDTPDTEHSVLGRC